MFFQKSNGKIFGVKLTKTEQKAVNKEINRQILENDKRFEIDRDAMILWAIHTEYGSGKRKLRKIWERFYDGSKKLREYYLMDPGDEPWIAKQKLKDIGCNVEQWYAELDKGKGE